MVNALDILSWLRTQEAALERLSSIAGISMSREAEVDTTDEEADDDEIDKASDGGGVSRLTKKSA